MPSRTEDMGTKKRLKITMQPDGDVVVSIVTGRGMPMRCADTDEDIGAEDVYATVEFCTSSGGGGQSRHTRAALAAVMEAMRRDDEERPDLHRPDNAFD